MSNGIKKKIEDLRQQPENVRIRAAAIFSAVGGGVLIMLWMFVLLPLELSTKKSASPSPFPTVAGTSSVAPTNTPIATLNPIYNITPTPVVTQVFEDLPSNSPAADTSSPTPTTASPSPSFSSLPVATTQPK